MTQSTRGLLRSWLVANFFIFLYCLPKWGTPIEEVSFLPNYILEVAIYVYNYLLSFINASYGSFSLNLLLALS